MMENKLLFVDYSTIYLENSWEWLNDFEIKNLTNTPNFSKEDQLSFYNLLPQKKDYYIRGIELDNKPIGVCGLKKITSEDAEYWGYIGVKEYWGKGIGKFIINYLIGIAKEKSLKSIYLHVIESNIRAIKLYVKIGFEVENTIDGLVKMRLIL
mgnify:CR=1 FL=1